MVKIKLKALFKSVERCGDYSVDIAEFNAGVILINNGIQITLSDKSLSKALKEFFDKYKKQY